MKFIDFLKSLFIPKKMEVHGNKKWYVSILLLLLSCVVLVASSVVPAINQKDSLIGAPEGLLNIDNTIIVNDISEISFNNNELSNDNMVFNSSYNNGTINYDITIITNKDITSDNESLSLVNSGFDLVNYLYSPKNDNTIYVLYFFTKDYLYINYNKDIASNISDTYSSLMYEQDSSGNIIYYLPSSIEEVSSYSSWSTVSNVDGEIEINNVTYKALPKFKDSVSACLYGEAFDYESLFKNGLNKDNLSTNLYDFIETFYNVEATILITQVVVYSLFISLLLNFLFGIAMCLLSWIVSKNAKLNKVKQYLGIYSICFLEVAIIGMIIGFFIPYISVSSYYLIATVVWYFIVIYQINKDDEKDKPSLFNNKPTSKEKEEFFSDTAVIG